MNNIRNWIRFNTRFVRQNSDLFANDFLGFEVANYLGYLAR